MIILGELEANGYWTSNHILVLVNVVLAAAAVATAIVGVRTIKASNRVAKSAEDQAKATNTSVTAALQQVELGRMTLAQEREALRTSVRPVVVDVPLGVFLTEPPQVSGGGSIRVLQQTRDDGTIWWRRDSKDNDTARITVPIRNVGPGSAFINSAYLSAGSEYVFAARVNHQVIPPGEMSWIVAEVTLTDSKNLVVRSKLYTSQLDVGLRYSDVGGGQRTETILTIGASELADERDPPMMSARAAVHHVELFRCTEEWISEAEPFVSTGPG
jgi:hypothetical protein